ncbi:hypothetical protein ISF_07402 [Cordyceps fumosorosea ARSEF 2679]|uniref:Protein BZZ1 n=1 Tax=Cordyceps fumosorosea (strain ARSEF 2679) TaxID=1081104 RepID=A0A167PPE4_CORFA|nr:hypothetical protein ISF_07402 [Cordyceps fumosorosea ARSEF 2679]OAA56886.1 hypothetical protein ISF_07402 [Cordyceps fumosorosea ARSEF 2679]
MAEVEAMPTFGAELKDGFKGANAWVGHGIAWLEDMQQFYRERAAIEKEYSAKLATLAKKYFEKKNKKSSQLSVGDTPSLTPGSLERCRLTPSRLHISQTGPDTNRYFLPSASITTWATQLTTLESRAAEHDTYANSLISQVAEPLRFYGLRFEELRKRHADYADHLTSERDASYEHLRKIKGKYDTTCQELEARRKKSESSYDKAKAQSAYQQQMIEMNNAKNTYLITINVTNKQKEVYYHEYVPEVMDSIQDLNEFRIIKLNGLWSAASQLEEGLMKQGAQLMQGLTQQIARNQPHLDSMMYMRHNLGGFQEPVNNTFEASPLWHDDNLMIVDEPAKVYLRNVLSKSKSQLGELRREVDRKRRDVESFKNIKQKVRNGTEKKDEVEVVTQLFALQQELHGVDRKRMTAEVETTTITAAVGDVTLGANNHNFKSQTFKIPTNCDLCGERIWGLSAKGFDCRDCGYTCHSKCEMKVSADCPGEQSKEDKKKLKVERQEAANKLLTPASAAAPTHVAELPDLSRSNTMNSLSSRSARRSFSGSALEAPAEDEKPRKPSPSPNPTGGRRNRVVAPPPAAYITDSTGHANGGSAEKKGKMIYPFEASGDEELTVQEGREVVLLDPDDGSGWVKVRAGYKEGIVPATYVDFSSASPTAPARPSSTYSTSTTSSVTPSMGIMGKKKGPAVAPKRGAKKLKYVEALYDYTAQTETEHSMKEGERFVLVKEDPGDGWVEVEKAGVTASVPGSYVQAV